MSSECISFLLRNASQQLSKSSDTPALDSEIILLYVLNKLSDKKSYNRAFLRTWPEYELNSRQLQLFQSCLKKRLDGIPIAYITGQKEFWSMELEVNESTLIPRPDTEILVETALKHIPINQPWNVLDLGTGSGAIALAIAKERPHCDVVAMDFSLPALQTAQRNAQKLAIENVYFYCGSWMSALPDSYFHLIVSNPPYIVANDPHLQLGDVRFEPASALASGPDGLDDIQTIISQTPEHLVNEGYLFIEHGYDQAKAIQYLLESNHYRNIQQARDLAGIIRVSGGKY